MGGDDLGSDDEYLNVKLTDFSASIVESDDESGNNTGEETNINISKRSNTTSDSDRKSKKRKTATQLDLVNQEKPVNKGKLLLETGRDIVDKGTDVQAAFLWSCYVHFLRDKNDENLVSKKSIFDSASFILSQKTSTPIPPQISPLGIFLKNSISSFKQLKKWKTTKSPMVLIVCLSARRATVILKSLSSMNIRTAKLFSKHFDLNQQITMLRENKYGIGVGTPNRLLKLASSNNGKPALSLKHTELLILDSHEDNKRFTLCTLNDTAPDLMEFIRSAVEPEFHRKKNPIKLAFV